MKIQLKDWKIKNLSFISNDKQKDCEEQKNLFNLETGNFFSENNDKEFGIGFRIEIQDEDFDISMEMIFIFELDSKIDDEFKNSDFITINAPAIAFPYVRSYISNLTLQSGFSPIILPSINFVELAKNKK